MRRDAGESLQHIRDVLTRTYEQMEELARLRGGVSGVPTGFYGLDNLLTGLHGGELILVGARPSMGKTSFDINMATHAIRKGFKVAVFSLEMPGEQLAMRMLCTEARVDMQHVRRGDIAPDEWERLADALDRWGYEVVRSREPGGTPIGEKIRAILLDRENTAMADETEALLYAASRAQHVREKIRPAVAEGKVVLCDRFLDSSVAYQGGGRELGIDKVLAINAPAVDGTLPDITVYLDIDHRKAMARRCAASEPDRLEMEAESFHARVEDGYHELIARDPGRFVAVNAEGTREEISEEIREKVLGRLMEMEQ
jgi:dTMP kinase